MKLRKVPGIAVLLLLVRLLIVAVQAAGCTLTVDPGDYGPMLEGARLTLYAVGTEEEGEIRLQGAFENSGLVLTEENLPYAAELLAEYAKAENLTGTQRQLGSTGVVCYESLAPGIYLLVQKERTPDDLTLIPFLVQILPEQTALTAYPKVTAPNVVPENPSLPQTGQVNWPIPVLLGIGAVLLIGGLCLRRLERR